MNPVLMFISELRRLATGVFPVAFSNQNVERDFLHEYRRAGLRSAAYACSVAIAAYVLIWIVDLSFGGWSEAAAIRRLLVMSALGVAIVIVHVTPTALLENYDGMMGALVLATYVLAVTLPQVFPEGDPSETVNPTALIGVWMIYGFFRLPLKLSMAVAAVGGACALFGYRLTNLDNPAIRTIVYIAIGNLLGITHARSVELRERQLFSQRLELERAEVELRHQNKLAEMASAEKTRLIAAVGHDLRQPMMAAKLHMSVLRHRLGEANLGQIRSEADRAHDAIAFLGDTLEDLLLASRYESGLQPVRLAPISIKAILTQLVKLTRIEADERQVELLVRFPKRDSVVVTDEHVLLRCLVNLTSNALKFSEAGKSRPRVVVRVNVRGASCMLSIVDNGIGIAASDAGAIWQPFYQVDNAERNRGKGLGLGLYLVKQALLRLERHGIQCRSMLGRGTRFVVSIPLHGDEKSLLLGSEDTSSCSLYSDSAQLGGGFVLLVEDDQQARGALEAQLSAWGLDFSSAGSLDEIFCYLKQDRWVDAIIADYRLPGRGDGIDVIIALREELGYPAEAILMTAEVDLTSLHGGLPHHTSLLPKPFEPKVLKSSLQVALSRSGLSK